MTAKSQVSRNVHFLIVMKKNGLYNKKMSYWVIGKFYGQDGHGYEIYRGTDNANEKARM